MPNQPEGLLMNAPALAFLAAVAVMLMSALAELWHARRIAAMARLAFGPVGKPWSWTRVVPALRDSLANLFEVRAIQFADPKDLDDSTHPASSIALCQ